MTYLNAVKAKDKRFCCQTISGTETVLNHEENNSLNSLVFGRLDGVKAERSQFVLRRDSMPSSPAHMLLCLLPPAPSI